MDNNENFQPSREKMELGRLLPRMKNNRLAQSIQAQLKNDPNSMSDKMAREMLQFLRDFQMTEMSKSFKCKYCHLKN